MAYDKVIDSAKLGSAMKATADTIRSKTGKSTPIVWDESSGFSGAIKTHSKSITPKASSQTVKPDSGYIGLSQVTVNGDANLKAANIKKGASIFGITGTLESGAQIAEGGFTPSQYSGDTIDLNPITVSGLPFKPSRVIFYVTSAVSNCDGVMMYDSGTDLCVGRWTEEYYDEYDDEYYDDIYCGVLYLSPTVTFTSNGFKVSATEIGEYSEMQWYPFAYRYIAFS